MKSFTIILPVLAALATAGKVDECAGSCISKAIEATGCASSDSLCICSSNSFIESVEECGPCAEDGSNAAVALAQDYCETVAHSNLKRSWEWGGHSYGWWQKEWRKVRAGWKDHSKPAPKPDPKPAAKPYPKPAPPAYQPPKPVAKPDPKPAPPAYQPPAPVATPKSEHPIEDWFKAHPNYLINHPGWLKNHPNWAIKHAEFLKHHLPKDSPYWGDKPHGGSPPSYPQHPQPPSDPHHPQPYPPPPAHTPTYKPTTTTKPCTTNKPSPTVIDYSH